MYPIASHLTSNAGESRLVSGAFGLMDVLRAAGLRYAGRGPNFVAGELRAPTKHAHHGHLSKQLRMTSKALQTEFYGGKRFRNCLLSVGVELGWYMHMQQSRIRKGSSSIVTAKNDIGVDSQRHFAQMNR